MAEHTEIAALRNEVAELKAQLTRLLEPSAAAYSATEPADATLSRRNWMKAALGAAVVGTAVAGRPHTVATVDPFDVVLGGVNTAANPTTVNFTGPQDVGFLAQSGQAFAANNSSIKAALAGWTSRLTNPVGVYGYTDVDSLVAAGVEGHSQTSSGFGMKARNRSSQGTAFRAEGGTGATGQGIFASGGVAMQATGTRAALHLTGANGDPTARIDAHFEGEIDVAVVAPGVVDVWVCVEAGTPGTWRKVAGSGTAGAFHPIEPVRAYDSRPPLPAPGILASGTDRTVSVADGRDVDTGAVTVADAVPVGATAVAYNLTITGTVGLGFLAVSPGDATAAGASAINWGARGISVANAGIIKLDAARQVKVFAGGAGSTHFIIDITGYYR